MKQEHDENGYGASVKKEQIAEHDLCHIVEDDSILDSPRLQNARVVKTILDDVYPKWQALIAIKNEDCARRPCLDRFECGMKHFCFCVVVVEVCC